MTILGGTKIKVTYDGNLPKTAESNGVRTDVTGAGPVVYALFADRDAAGRARAALEGRAAALWLAEPA